MNYSSVEQARMCILERGLLKVYRKVEREGMMEFVSVLTFGASLC